MIYNTGLTIFWLVMLGICLTVTAVAMPIVEAKTVSIKNFGIKCILITVVLLIACGFSVLYSYLGGSDVIRVGPEGSTGSLVNIVYEVLLPMFLIFAVYFLLLGIFFPEKKYELEKKLQEWKAHEEAQREREKREQNKKNNS